MEKTLQYRMYGLVPYNISEIQRGIQFGHGVVEYSIIPEYQDLYRKFAKNDKTFIILNGGTTNNQFKDGKFLGTLNQHYQTLIENDIDVSTFYEPDLGNQLTAIVFLVDERVWDREKYPDKFLGGGDKSGLAVYYEPETDESYINRLGGEQNVWLRQFLSQFKLA